ncbi:MAG TPA: hypothetical protein VFM51_00105 [Solirubrobacterales bacterium]|nr:hypothetical protein [Solirubrobacterales bacterium]
MDTAVDVSSVVISWWLILVLLGLPALWLKGAIRTRRGAGEDDSPWLLFEGPWSELPAWKKPVQATWFGAAVFVGGVGAVLFVVAAVLWAAVAVTYVLAMLGVIEP